MAIQISASEFQNDIDSLSEKKIILSTIFFRLIHRYEFYNAQLSFCTCLFLRSYAKLSNSMSVLVFVREKDLFLLLLLETRKNSLYYLV